MQDDYNRFIRNSIKQAQCNYEDIFDEDVMAEESESFCSMNVRSEQSDKCGYNDVRPAQTNRRSCGNVQSAQTNKRRGSNMQVQSQQIPHRECEQMCRPVNELPVMVFIEMQEFGRMYNEAEGLQRGTMFPALDKPFMGGGCHC